nr:MAG TPA: hypothetical protein [Caudoviricetes sp.]
MPLPFLYFLGHFFDQIHFIILNKKSQHFLLKFSTFFVDFFERLLYNSFGRFYYV